MMPSITWSMEQATWCQVAAGGDVEIHGSESVWMHEQKGKEPNQSQLGQGWRRWNNLQVMVNEHFRFFFCFLVGEEMRSNPTGGLGSWAFHCHTNINTCILKYEYFILLLFCKRLSWLQSAAIMPLSQDHCLCYVSFLNLSYSSAIPWYLLLYQSCCQSLLGIALNIAMPGTGIPGTTPVLTLVTSLLHPAPVVLLDTASWHFCFFIF